MNDLFDVGRIEREIGYSFKDKELLKTCFVHSSYTNEHKGAENNEKLEFLGDAVLELVFSEKLYHECGNEGAMTQKRQKFVSDESLEKVARRLGLERYLFAGGGSVNIGKKAIPSLVEALIAGIYLDGGYVQARKFVLENIQCGGKENYVGALQELLQAQKKPLPEYVCKGNKGTDNEPVFVFSAKADGIEVEGVGNSKKEARMQAAENLYRLIKKR